MDSEKRAIRGWKDGSSFCTVAKHSMKIMPLVSWNKDTLLNKILAIKEGIIKKYFLCAVYWFPYLSLGLLVLLKKKVSRKLLKEIAAQLAITKI